MKRMTITVAWGLTVLFGFASEARTAEKGKTTHGEAFVLPGVPTVAAKAAARTTLLAHFDSTDRPDADYARWNPLSAGRDTTLAMPGKFGKAVAFTQPRACVIFGGEENCPTSQGTVEMYVRSTPGTNIWADGKEHWFAYLGRSMVNNFIDSDTDARRKRGFSLGLYKDRQNRLVLACYQMDYQKSYVFSQLVTDRLSLPADAWHHILFGWDLKAKRMFLAVNGKGRWASLPLDFSPGDFSTILVGNHPTQDLPAGCLLDELAISDRPPTERSPDMGAAVEPKPLPQAHRWKSPFENKGLEKMGVHEAALLKTERKVWMWLDWVVRAQRGGGWHTMSSAIRWPSLLSGWTGQRGRLCTPRNFVHFGKSENTSHVALQLCFAAEALGDDHYLQAARRTAVLYLSVQQKRSGKGFKGEVGWWPRYTFVLPDRVIPGAGVNYVMIQDFYVTGPIRTLLYVYKLTGERKYLEGAMRGGHFLLLAQNPSGSWPHHYDWDRQAGYGNGSPDRPYGNDILHGGELNDSCTQDVMWTMIALWHQTKDRRYLLAFRRAADWVVEAQLDGPTHGWADQYDRNNVPSWARYFEPPADSWSGSSEAAKILLLAHQITRNG